MRSPQLERPPLLALRAALRRFITTEVKPQAAAWEASGTMPAHLLARCGQQGWLGLSLPTSVGGQGHDFWSEVVLAEELARSRALGWSLSLLAHANMVAPLVAALGTPDQITQIVQPALRGDHYLALAVTEASSGSDLLEIATVASPLDDGYRLSGEKRYITNGSLAKHLVVLARTNETPGPWSLSLFVIGGDRSGVQRERLETVGLRTGDTAQLKFTDCRVPESARLGRDGGGFTALVQGLQCERLLGAVAANALADEVLSATVQFLQQRVRFGEPLMRKQALRHRLAELSAKLEASRQFTDNVCSAYAQGLPADREVLMLKVVSYELCQEIVSQCVHWHGAAAFLNDHWLAHAARDCQALSLVAGTSEVMRDLLAQVLEL